MGKSSKYYYNTYIPMLNVLKGIIIKGFGRQLFIKYNPLIEAVNKLIYLIEYTCFRQYILRLIRFSSRI